MSLKSNFLVIAINPALTMYGGDAGDINTVTTAFVSCTVQLLSGAMLPVPCGCIRACVRACARVCVRACACVYTCMGVCVSVCVCLYVCVCAALRACVHACDV